MKVYAGGWPSHDTGVAREGGVVHGSMEHLGRCEVPPSLFFAILARGWFVRLLQISSRIIYHSSMCEAL